MGGTKVREVMTDNPRCVTPETPVSEAARLMRSEDVGSLPILEGKKVTGVITDRDIVIRAVAEEKDPRGMPVREVAMAAHGDVEVARVVNHRIPIGIHLDPDRALPALERLHVARRVVVVVKVDHSHAMAPLSLSNDT